MPTPTRISAPVEPVPAGALAQTWSRLRRSLLRHVVVVGLLCLGIAVLLTAIDGRGFFIKLVYSLCIGTVCTLVVDGTRLGLAWWSDRNRRARGLPPVENWNGWIGAVPGSLLALVAGAPLGRALGDVLLGRPPANLLNLASADVRITLVLAVLGTVVSMVVISTLERMASAREQAQAAERQAAESQLRLLQSQLEPHMLFNTLANLRVLIGLDAAQAQLMLDRLIAFLRATLNASRTPAHPLATEFERIGDYLALMGVRMGPRLAVDLDLPTALRELPVPPLLLQPLVENAIQHGLEPQVQGGRIHVQARSEGGSLVLSVRDTGLGLGAAAATAGTHFGLSQVRQRLATLHGDKASLVLQAAGDADGGTLAILRLPLPNPAPAPTPAPA